MTGVLIVLLRTVDVAAIGPSGTSVGLSHINGAVSGAVGLNMLWYKITEFLGYTAIASAAVFPVVGLVQLIKRKSIKEVDREIFVTGGLYAAVLCIYILFEKVIINYRPVIMPGDTEPEASFPSSHTMLACTILGSTTMVLDRYIKDERLCKILKAVCFIVMAAIVIGRFLAGVHWFTDIAGSLLISSTLLLIFSAVIEN